MENRNNKKELVRVSDLVVRLENCISDNQVSLLDNELTKSQKQSIKRSIDRYQFALRIANGIKPSLKVNVKTTANGAVNVGELGETYIKYKLNSNKRIIRTSKQGEKDLPQYHKSEIKVVSKTSKSNSWNASKGAYVIVQGCEKAQVNEGIYWITRDELRTEFSNGDRLSHSGIAKVIKNYEIGRVRVGA